MSNEEPEAGFLDSLLPGRAWATMAVAGAVLAGVGTTRPWIHYEVDDFVGPPSVLDLPSLDGSFAGIDGAGALVFVVAVLVAWYVYWSRDPAVSTVAVLGAVMLYRTGGVLADPATINDRISGKYVSVTTFEHGHGLVLSLVGSVLVLLSTVFALAGSHLAAQVDSANERDVGE